MSKMVDFELEINKSYDKLPQNCKSSMISKLYNDMKLYFKFYRKTLHFKV